MSEPGPSGDNPFEGVPFLGDLSRMMGGQQSVAWDAARQLAISVATDGESEPNVDPVERMAYDDLARVAELHVAESTGLSVSTTSQAVQILPVTRAQWARRSLTAYRPLFDRLGEALSAREDDADDELAGDPMAGIMVQLMQMLSPMMISMTSGSMVGHLGQRSFGQYDLPVPRPRSDEVMVVPAAISAFGEEWSIAPDDLRLWICLHQLTHHAVIGVPHVRERLTSLLHSYAGGFRADIGGLERELSDIDPSDPQALARVQETIRDPELLLGAIVSPEQEVLRPQLAALTAAITGYVDHVMDRVGGRLISDYDMITEAMRRRRVEAAPSDRFVERLLGLELGQAQYDRGAAFVDGVAERAAEQGVEGLERLWSDEAHLPTPAEVDAPGLWLARIDLPDDG